MRLANGDIIFYPAFTYTAERGMGRLSPHLLSFSDISHPVAVALQGFTLQGFRKVTKSLELLRELLPGE